MKFNMIAVLLVAGLGVVSCQDAKVSKSDFKTQKDSVSYAIGADIGKNLKMNELDVDLKMLYMGMKDAIVDSNTVLTEDEMQDVMVRYQTELMAKKDEKNQVIGKTNKEAGEKFLADNAKKEGVVTLPSGLQYKVITKGNGASPKATDKVTTHYRGSLIDGTVFDESYQRGEPIEFPVNGVIAGWTEVLQLMKVGDKWEVYIPSNLAYGDRGAGAAIGPNATLIFTIELLKVN
ncbi:MAG: FKBP-type peptidyl-prolyl cis-trans isomerase [Ignavibacteriaceae bacterium]|nr:FKBP-type peptidyl-prolyl cis-trans isomerase [Ignavibacteriaceae bacterium]